MTTRKPAVKGTTPEERREAKERRRQHNRLTHVADRVAQARNGRERLVVACNAALAASKRLTDDARRRLADEIVAAVDRFDTTENRKAQS